MSDGQQIAKLVAHLGFTVEDKQLDTFLSKLNVAITALKDLKSIAQNRISFKFDLNKTDLIGAKKTIATLGDTKIRLKDIEASPARLSMTSRQIAEKLATAKIRLTDINVSEASIRKIKSDVKESIKVGGVTVPVKADTKQLGKDLRDWVKNKGKYFKIHLQAEVNKHTLYTNLNAAIKAATDKVGTIKLKDPNIRVGIDKPHLTKEIKDALAQIKRDVKIKIDLTGHGSVSGGGGGASGAGGRVVQGRHAIAAGGLAGMAMGAGRAVLPGFGGIWGVGQLNRQVQEFESQQQAAAAVTGSQEAGTATLERLRSLGNEVGFDYRSQAMPLLRMISSGTNAGMEQGQVEGIFGNMAKYGRVMGLDDEAMKGSMRAVEQMLNKQQVYSEELKTQLAERMPGVISAMAEAVTGDANNTAELFDKMEKGQVKSTEVLGEFSEILRKRAEAGDALARAMQSTAAEQARFYNSWNDFVKKFGESGFSETMGDFFEGAADMFDSLNKHAKKAAQAFRILLTPVLALMRIIEHADFGKMAESIGLTTGELQTMAVVVGGLLFPWTRMLTIIGLVITAVDDLMSYSRGEGSLFGDWFNSLDEKQQEALLRLFNSLKETMTALKNVGMMIFDGWKNIFALFGEGDPFTGVINILDDILFKIRTTLELLLKIRDESQRLMGGGDPTKTAGQERREEQNLADLTNPNSRLSKAGQVDQMLKWISERGGKYSPAIATVQVNLKGINITAKGVDYSELEKPEFRTELKQRMLDAAKEAFDNHLGSVIVDMDETQ